MNLNNCWKNKVASFWGWGLLLVITVVATLLSEMVEVGGKHPLEPSALAIVCGILLANGLSIPQRFQPGLKSGEKFLTIGIVLLGASLNFHSVFSHGADILTLIVVTMAIGFLATLALGRWNSISSELSLLLAVGTTICGGTAIAITAPLIRAKPQDTSYAVATITLWGVAATLLYPALGRLVGADDFHFGLFAGTAIHSTPQVVGAGFIFSDAAGKIATAVKLVRNCFIVPLAFVIAIWHANAPVRSASDSVQANFWRVFPWFLFAFFFLSWMNTQGYIEPDLAEQSSTVGKFLVNVGMAAVGMGTSLASIRQAGLKPLVIGLLGTLVVGAVSIALIKGMI